MLGRQDGEFTRVSLQPLQKLKCGHDFERNVNALFCVNNALRLVERLGFKVFGENGVAFKLHTLGLSVADHRDAHGVSKVILRLKALVHAESGFGVDLESRDAVAPKRPNVIPSGIPAQQVPPVSVLFQQIRMQVVARGRVG